MDSNKVGKLRQFYFSLLGQQQVLDHIASSTVRDTTILPIVHELEQINKEFPSLMPAFNKHDYYLHTSYGRVLYNVNGIRAYIAMALGRLKIAEEPSVSIPITEKRQFSFVSDAALRRIIERDYEEIQKAYISQCWKSVIILCGGAIEAILTDLLIGKETAAKATKSVPKESDITRWDLSSLINVAVELSLVSEGVEKLSHSIREYRNLVHPGNELRNKLRFDAEEAKIAVEVLNIVHRDLSN